LFDQGFFRHDRKIMKRRIKHIAPLQAGKMLGVLYGCMGLIFLPFLALAGMAGAFAQNASHTQGGPEVPAALVGGMMLGLGIMMPVIYGVFGFIFGIISAAIYNVIARWIGGIEVEVEEA
jgi:Transmembrane domain of unknown function (DUF3566)